VYLTWMVFLRYYLDNSTHRSGLSTTAPHRNTTMGAGQVLGLWATSMLVSSPANSPCRASCCSSSIILSRCS
jgi:hypothetical protein